MASLRVKSGQCVLCHRTCSLTFHHLIPKKLHRRAYFRKTYSRGELAKGINICRQCHSGIHKAYDEMRLAKEFNTLNAIRSDDGLIRHFEWVGRQKIQS